ncbi:MAG: tRNA glutamyl-Q(34) synthetase GluQRS [Hyphomicrobiaceae bacterium]
MSPPTIPPVPTFRFAPSPNGDLHLGHALSAMVGFNWARRLGGRFLVRIEDIDLGRSRPEFVAHIFEDLDWLGLTWELPVLRQSERFAVYRDAVEKLRAMGLLYPCHATRSEIADAVRAQGSTATDPDGAPLYPGLYRNAAASPLATGAAGGMPAALRLDMARALATAAGVLGGAPPTFEELNAEGLPQNVTAHPERWGDAVIARKDVSTSYHLAVVVDDAAQGVTHVTRGRDLFAATDLQRLLQVLLGLPAPLYHHHRLLTDATGRKLAKSERDVSLRQLRRDGATAEDIWEKIGMRPQG